MIDIKHIEKRQPKMSDVQIHVAYSDECNFEFDGRYRFRLMGQAKFNGLKVPPGFYQGQGKVHLQPMKGTHILFERFPIPRTPTRKPIPVPDVINDISIEEQIARGIAHGIKQLQPESKDDDIYFDDYDTDDLDYVSDEYVVEFSEESTDFPPDSLEEPEPTGDPEPDTVKAEPDGDSPTQENATPSQGG